MENEPKKDENRVKIDELPKLEDMTPEEQKDIVGGFGSAGTGGGSTSSDIIVSG